MQSAKRNVLARFTSALHPLCIRFVTSLTNKLRSIFLATLTPRAPTSSTRGICPSTYCLGANTECRGRVRMREIRAVRARRLLLEARVQVTNFSRIRSTIYVFEMGVYSAGLRVEHRFVLCSVTTSKHGTR